MSLINLPVTRGTTLLLSIVFLAVVVVSGLLYLFLARPDKKSTAAHGDAIEVAAQIRARRS